MSGLLLFGGWSRVQVLNWVTEPQAILVLGGHEDRERYAAKLAVEYPNLPVWVSSGSPKDYAANIFAQAGVSPERLHLDYRAVDTVTNFTTLVVDLKAHNIKGLYLVTSESHMRRSHIIGDIVFGTQGIGVKYMAVHDHARPEPVQKSWRDGARAVAWVLTGRTGTSLRRWQEKLTLRDSDRD
ncbi:MAG: YdcF family protein [Cyanobacteria bacterium P01_H01_bin.15]